MNRLHHSNLRIVDVDDTLRFYLTIGFQPRGFMDLGYAYVIYLALPNDEGLLELALGVDVDETWLTTPGSGHVAITVDDLHGELTRLADLGVFPDSEPFSPGGRAGLLVCFFTDPNGHKLEMIQGPFNPPQDPIPAALQEYWQRSP